MAKRVKINRIFTEKTLFFDKFIIKIARSQNKPLNRRKIKNRRPKFFTADRAKK